MNTNIIVISKNKIIFNDAVLPLLLELNSRHTNIDFLITVPDHDAFNALKQNYHIWECYKKINSKVYVLKGKSKLRSYWNYIKYLARLCLRKNIILKSSDALPYHSRVMKVIKRISKSIEMYCFIQEQTFDPLRSCEIAQNYYREVKTQRMTKPPFKTHYDYLISWKSRSVTEEYLNTDIREDKFIQCGYVKKFPKWSDFLLENAERNPKLNKQKYFLYLLGPTGMLSHYLKQLPGEIVMEESLKILKKYNEALLTIFKPHPTTDISVLKGIIDKIGYKNYLIDYAHPMVLSAKASFVIAPNFTSCMNNSYFQGIPNIEFTSYDSVLYERYGKQSYGGKMVDFFLLEKDWSKLEETTGKILNDEIKIQRDKIYIDKEYPDTPLDFWLFWEMILNGN